jgi:hypothetical protein
MKVNKKALELIDKGLSANTVKKLTESQIETLHSKLSISEQVVEVPSKKTYKVGPKGGSLPPNSKGYSVRQDPNTKEVMATAAEGEVKETETDDVDDKNSLGADALQNLTGQDAPHMANDMAPDGIDDDSDNDRQMMGMSEEDLKPGQPNPWAICHAQVGPKKTRKFERCVKSVKKQLEEGKNPVSLFIESEITKIVERNILPRITKGDLLKYLSEQNSPLTAPVKPITKPDTKPSTRPSHPGKNPRPGEEIAPKAAEPTTAPTKPITKPGTKPTTRPSHPGKNPRPGEEIAPKAGKISPEDAKQEVIDVILNLLK